MAAVDTGLPGSPLTGPHTSRQMIITGNRTSILTSNNEANLVLKSTPGFIHSLAVGNVGTAWQIDFFDNATGTGTRKLWTWTSADGKGPFGLQFPCSNGVMVTTSGTTPGQATIVWS